MEYANGRYMPPKSPVVDEMLPFKADSISAC